MVIQSGTRCQMWKTPTQRPARIKTMRKVTHPQLRIKLAKAASVNLYGAGNVLQSGPGGGYIGLNWNC